MVTGTQKIIDAKIGALDAKIDALDAKIDAKTGALDAKIDAKIGALDAKIDAMQNQLTEIRADVRMLVADRFGKNPNVG